MVCAVKLQHASRTPSVTLNWHRYLVDEGFQGLSVCFPSAGEACTDYIPTQAGTCPVLPAAPVLSLCPPRAPALSGLLCHLLMGVSPPQNREPLEQHRQGTPWHQGQTGEPHREVPGTGVTFGRCLAGRRQKSVGQGWAAQVASHRSPGKFRHEALLSFPK